MDFKTASSVLTQIGQMQWASQPAQQNRARINRLFNGDSPWTEEERLRNRIQTNFNWLEPTRIAANSRYQIENAFTQPGDYFDIRLDKGPAHKRDEWSRCLTTYINTALRRDRERRFTSARNQAFAQTVLHGPGPSLWRNRKSPAPSALGVDDVLVPSGTLADMSNLDYLAIYREWTWSQLYDLTHGPAVDPGWNMPYIDGLLASLYKLPLQPLYQGNRWLFPEKIAEDAKENSSTWSSNSLARLLAWDFYYRDEHSEKWNRRIIIDYNNVTPEGFANTLKNHGQDFLYKKDAYADSWSEIIHWFTGNCSNVAPFRYYSMRSIGFLLYGVSLVQNTIRCRMTDHLLQSLLVWFRNVSEDDRERLEDISLQHLGIFPDGVTMVGTAERYTADWNLVQMGLQQNRQLMAESATAFLPDIAVEGEKAPMTATETLIRNNASVTLTSAVLNQLYDQSEPLYREMCRRFCLKDSNDPMAKRLREQMRDEAIPLSMLDCESWEITPNRVMGGGNKAVELTSARALFEIRGALGPQGAAIATRKYVLALTNDAAEANLIVPEAEPITSATTSAAYAFGTLMEGVPCPTPPGINETEYIETLLQLMAQAMAPLEQLQEQPTALPIAAERIAGLVNVGQHIEQHIALLSQDEGAREKVRDYERIINQLMQQLKAYGQRLAEMEQAQAEAQQAQGGVSPEAQAKIISAQIVAESKAQIMAATAAQKQQHKDVGFTQEQERKNAATSAEIQRKSALTAADIAAKDLTTRADLIHTAATSHHDRQEAAVDAAHDRAQAAADAAQDREHAAAEARAKKTASK